MKISTPQVVSLLSLVGFLAGVVHFWRPTDLEESPPFSEVFPAWNDVVSMAHLSHLVYDFKSVADFTCANFTSFASANETKDLSCEWYIHDYSLGTQVLLVSNKKEKYVAVIFAGTDDIRTSLEDTNILTKKFGNNLTVRLDEKYNNVRVHAGFNNAVFTHDIWEQIYFKTQEILQKHPSYRLWTTGHSLGGANAILTATAFASLDPNRKVLSVNFGTPQTGNKYWKDFFNSTSPLNNNLGIWRVVLAWDLVPRLPQFFYHIGHTIQVDADTRELKVYYKHDGDVDRGYAGVPSGWYSKSYAWLPYAVYYHHMYKYTEYMNAIDPADWTKTTFQGINASAFELQDFPDPFVTADQNEFVEPDDTQPILRQAIE